MMELAKSATHPFVRARSVSDGAGQPVANAPGSDKGESATALARNSGVCDITYSTSSASKSRERASLMAWRRGWCWLFIGLFLLPLGCTPPKKKRNDAAIREEVAESFEKLKAGIAELRKEDGNTDIFWNVLSEASKADAGKRAKAFR